MGAIGLSDEFHDHPHVPAADHDSVVMPAPTVAPLVLALGLAVAATSVAFGLAFAVVGSLLVVSGLGMWIAHLLPGRGHCRVLLVAPEDRAAHIGARLGMVTELHPGVPGYRFRMPEKVHPLSAGIKGGIAGGLLMPIPALSYGILSGHGIWYPVNLLAGMVLPGMGEMTLQQLEAFRPDLLIVSCMIHVVISLIVGLIYGVLMPTLPSIPKPLAWGGLLMPILWTGTMYLTLGAVDQLLSNRVDWPCFIGSQFLFGVVVAVVVHCNPQRHSTLVGLLGGFLGGLLMPLPAIVWALSTGRTIWYPANLLAAMVYPEIQTMPTSELQAFQWNWLLSALAIHLFMTVLFGLIYGTLLPQLPRIPAPMAWGGLVLPLMWTGMSYGFMGIVNPLLQERVDWPWFVVSQFLFGIAAAIVVLRSEMVYIAPAGQGPEDGQDTAAKWLNA